MQKYQCHKIVEAVKISTIAQIGISESSHSGDAALYQIIGDDGAEYSFSTQGKAPAVGDYLVQYADGYKSWSPAAAFEKGYTVIKEPTIAPVFLHNWKDDGVKQLKNDFEIKDEDALAGAEILLASYTYEDYSGDAFVLFRKDGKLWEVNGGHCSCNGLEGQWRPQETDVAALEHRLNEGTLGRSTGYSNDGANIFATELRQVLALIKEGK